MNEADLMQLARNRYDKFIEVRFNRPDCHWHHIVPKSIGGNNSASNLICLSIREHYIAHLLLANCYKKGSNEWHKMQLALCCFSAQGKCLNSRQIARAIKAMSDARKGLPHSENHRKNLANSIRQFYKENPGFNAKADLLIQMCYINKNLAMRIYTWLSPEGCIIQSNALDLKYKLATADLRYMPTWLILALIGKPNKHCKGWRYCYG